MHTPVICVPSPNVATFCSGLLIQSPPLNFPFLNSTPLLVVTFTPPKFFVAFFAPSTTNPPSLFSHFSPYFIEPVPLYVTPSTT